MHIIGLAGQSSHRRLRVNSNVRHQHMIVHHGESAFEFDPDRPKSLRGYLKLDSERAKLLVSLVESEPEDWYLDQNGERLSQEQLFALSPWSTATGTKLLCRLLNTSTGEVMFSEKNTYGGEFFSSFVRGRSEDA